MSDAREKVLTLKPSEAKEWDRIIDSFIYNIPQQRSGWMRAYETHGYDGKACLFYCETKNLRAVNTLFLKPYDDDQEKTEAITPYTGTSMHIEKKEGCRGAGEEREGAGEGGFDAGAECPNVGELYQTEVDEVFAAFDAWLKENGISREKAVFRYDAPKTFDRERYYEPFLEINTYVMHAGTDETIIASMHKEQKRNLKKGINAGLKVDITDYTPSDAELLHGIYTEFINGKRHFAYYDYSEEFLVSLAGEFSENLKLVKVYDGGVLLTELLLVTGNNVTEVLLVANTEASYNTGSNALMYFELARLAHKNGCKYLSLGTAGEGGLSRFKLHLDKNGLKINPMVIHRPLT
ncbi:MAG: GNAT family N-acetyltransferase [Eubacteriales bacterium]|nr:GNAT family N-acetyltransferase [Eubacteriales bacterium]